MDSAKKRLLKHFQDNVGKMCNLSELSEVAGTTDFTRTLRTLKSNDGYDIELIKQGEGKGCYVMRSLNKSEGKPRGAIDAKMKYRILQRDQSKCQRCGRGVADGVKLAIDHKKPVDWGGESTDENLWVLCEECNLGKKNWLSDEDAETMKKVMSQTSALGRLKVYFEMNPDKTIDVTKLAVIGGVREWTRIVRTLRDEHAMNVQPVRKNMKNGIETDGYIYRP